jgi:hypothetical protein
MTVPAGTYLNAFPVALPDRQTVTRIPLPSPTIARREMERRHGARLFIHDGAAWTARALDDQPRVELSSDEHLPVHVFNLREALRAQAEANRWEFWIRQGEMNAVQPGAGRAVGPFVVQPVLKARAVWEGIQAQELLLVASSSVRWLVDKPLAAPDVQAVAVGEHVLRRQDRPGNAPRRGRVDGFSGGDVLLAGRDGGQPQGFPVADYQLVARPALVYRLLLQTVSRPEASRLYNELLAASGTLLPTDKRTPNKYAGKDRFNETERLLDAFGRDLPFENGVRATVATVPHEVYVISVKGAITPVASCRGVGCEDRRHALLLFLPRLSGSAWPARPEPPRPGREGHRADDPAPRARRPAPSDQPSRVPSR